MPSEGEGNGPNGRATVTWDAASGNGTSITKYVIRGGPSPVSVDASTRSHTFTNLNNGSSYQFTVEARNGFEANGGVSERSTASNEVKPYKKPSNPTASTSRAACSAKDKCPVTLKANAGSSDGGAGGMTLEVRIDGGSWQKSGSSYSDTFDTTSGKTHRIEARVVNAKGLVSGTVEEKVTAQTYTPPVPKGSVGWHGRANNDVCTTEYCRLIDIKASDLEPGKKYQMRFYTNPSSASSGGDWVENPQFTAPADGSWGTYSDGGLRYLYGYPYNTFDVYLADADGSNERKLGTFTYENQ